MADIIKEIKNKLESSGVVTFEEITKGNYDKSDKPIEIGIPTLTTEYCEIGSYGDEVYFVFIIKSDSWSGNLFNLLKNMSGIELYGLSSFRNNYDLDKIEDEIKREPYFQLQLNFNINKYKAEELVGYYKKITHDLIENNAKIVNQLIDNWEK